MPWHLVARETSQFLTRMFDHFTLPDEEMKNRYGEANSMEKKQLTRIVVRQTRSSIFSLSRTHARLAFPNLSAPSA